MLKRKGTFTILMIVSLLVLSFGSAALANNGTEVQVNESRELNEQENLQENKQEQIKTKQGDGECDEDCDPEQKRLQLKEDKQELMQERQGGRNQENGKGQRQTQNQAL